MSGEKKGEESVKATERNHHDLCALYSTSMDTYIPAYLFVESWVATKDLSACVRARVRVGPFLCNLSSPHPSGRSVYIASMYGACTYIHAAVTRTLYVPPLPSRFDPLSPSASYSWSILPSALRWPPVCRYRYRRARVAGLAAHDDVLDPAIRHDRRRMRSTWQWVEMGSPPLGLQRAGGGRHWMDKRRGGRGKEKS
jgi:hypothetical protein